MLSPVIALASALIILALIIVSIMGLSAFHLCESIEDMEAADRALHPLGDPETRTRIYVAFGVTISALIGALLCLIAFA